MKVTGACLQVLELAERVHDGKSEQSVYALVSTDEQPKVHLLPDSALTRPLLETPNKPLHFWRAETSTGESARCFLTFLHSMHSLDFSPCDTSGQLLGDLFDVKRQKFIQTHCG